MENGHAEREGGEGLAGREERGEGKRAKGQK